MSTSTKIEFSSIHTAILPYGEYDWKVEQTVKGGDVQYKPGAVQKMYVNGPRFSLNKNMIQSVYPPQSGQGQYFTVLPWLTLGHSTLPWERTSSESSPQAYPWLALLLFSNDEMQNTPEQRTKGMGFNDLGPVDLNAVVEELFIEGVKEEPLFNGKDKVNYLTLGDSLVDLLFSKDYLDELTWLTHCRTIKGGPGKQAGSSEHELAVIMANRLPKQGAKNSVYLVSLENRFDANGVFKKSVTGNNKLVYLHKWDFYCQAETVYHVGQQAINAESKLASIQGNLYTELAEFENALAPLGLTPEEIRKVKALCKFDESLEATFKNLNCGLLRYNPPGEVTDDSIKQQLNIGAIPLQQKFIEGETLSWFHGPLVPSPIIIDSLRQKLQQSIRHPEELYLFDNQTNVLDASYAAAFELGRMLCLKDTEFAMQLKGWKDEGNKKVKLAELLADSNTRRIAPNCNTNTEVELSDAIRNRFQSWCRLEDVPASYLIPLAEMIPPESLRLFYLDRNWIEALIAGAFQLGGYNHSQLQLKEMLSYNILTAKKEDENLMGILLRSDGVACWPGLEIAACKESVALPENFSSTVKVLRKAKLAPDILFYLFDGSIKVFDFFLKPQQLHAGFSYDPLKPGAANTINKIVRNAEGNEAVDKNNNPVEFGLPFHDPVTRVIDVTDLANKMSASMPTPPKTFNAAYFGMQMIEGVPRVRFRIE